MGIIPCDNALESVGRQEAGVTGVVGSSDDRTASAHSIVMPVGGGCLPHSDMGLMYRPYQMYTLDNIVRLCFSASGCILKSHRYSSYTNIMCISNK